MPSLRRTLSLPLLVFYGLGTIVGAGIYVLIGEVAAIAGSGMAWSFLLAGIIAVLSGASYAELSARYPQSAGAVLFVDVAFGFPLMSRIVAAMLLFTGVVSAAVICQGFVGYFQVYVQLDGALVIVLLVLAMILIASWGIRESAMLIAGITLLEVGGLLIVALVASQLPLQGSVPTEPYVSEPVAAAPGAILIAAFLAFYAFIGFEDMVNVAEEVVEPDINMPLGILIAVVVSTALYLLVSVVAVLRVDLVALGKSSSPLTLMVGHEPVAMLLITLISMVAILNGALVQIIMSARVMYGMAQRGLLPPFFSRINPRTNTPVVNTIISGAAVLVLALTLELVTLAKMTSTVMLLVFVLVNVSLIRIKRSVEKGSYSGFRVPLGIPMLALGSSLALLLAQLF